VLAGVVLFPLTPTSLHCGLNFCLSFNPLPRFLLQSKMQAVSPSISVGGVPARIAFSSALIASCVSSSFWHNNERSLSSEFSVVRYSVTAQCPECVFTTILEFHVCDDLPFDAVFGNDFVTVCAQGSGMFFPTPFLFIANDSTSTVTNPFLSPLYYIHDEHIQNFNRIIALASQNVQPLTDNNLCCVNPYPRTKWDLPYNYQANSTCTLQDAAASHHAVSIEEHALPLLRDVLLKKSLPHATQHG